MAVADLKKLLGKLLEPKCCKFYGLVQNHLIVVMLLGKPMKLKCCKSYDLITQIFMLGHVASAGHGAKVIIFIFRALDAFLVVFPTHPPSVVCILFT